MSHAADIARQELLEAARVAVKHIREKEMGYPELINSRNRQAVSNGQDKLDRSVPEDDLTFLDDDPEEVVEFDRTEEEELKTTGAGRVIDPEDLWAALCWNKDFRAIRDEVIAKLMKDSKYKQARAERMSKDAELEMEQWQ